MHRNKYICLNCFKVYKLDEESNNTCPHCHSKTLINVGDQIRFPKKKTNKQIKKFLDDNFNILRMYYQSLTKQNSDLSSAITHLFPKVGTKLRKKFKGINVDLAIRRNICYYAVEEIKRIHDKIKTIFLLEEGLVALLESDIDESKRAHIIKTGKKFDKELKELEFQLQGLWQYDKDETMHTRWFTQPLCKCPVKDNFDRLGSNRRVINSECPLHGI